MNKTNNPNRYKITFGNFILLFGLFVNQAFGQQSSLPFENNEITVEKVFAIFFGLCVYFTPIVIARDKKQFKLIFLFNLLSGWTILGWLLTLFWAINSKKMEIKSISANLSLLTN